MIELGVSRMRPTIERRQHVGRPMSWSRLSRRRPVLLSMRPLQAATEAAAGALSRAFAAAEVSGPHLGLSGPSLRRSWRKWAGSW